MFLKQNGTKLIDLTFYGLEERHDQFADRKGDFNYLLKIIDIANEIELDVEVGIVITKDNINDVSELVKLLETKTKSLFIFAPHSGGIGININDKKISLFDYESLDSNSKKYFNRNKFKT